MNPDQTSLEEDLYRFRTTRWSVVLLSAQSQALGFGAALSELYRIAARWAMALLGEAMNRLRQEYAIGQNGATFETLKAFLEVGNGKEPPTYEQAAAALQLSVGAVKTLIHRLRKQYTASVREEIGRTVSTSAEVDAEIHELCQALVFAEGWILP